MDNVAIIVEDEARGRNLFGLYEGIPLTRRGFSSYNAVMPDRITLYQKTICRVCANEDDVRAQVRKTVIHEIAHHFGISDPRLDELAGRNSFASAATAPVWHRANTTPIVRPDAKSASSGRSSRGSGTHWE